MFYFGAFSIAERSNQFIGLINEITFRNPRFEGYVHLTWAYRELVAPFIVTPTKKSILKAYLEDNRD